MGSYLILGLGLASLFYSSILPLLGPQEEGASKDQPCPAPGSTALRVRAVAFRVSDRRAAREAGPRGSAVHRDEAG